FDSKGRKGDGVSFEKYLTSRCISTETNRFMKKRLKNIQKEVNKKVENVFETKVESAISEVALGVLKSNSTYNEAKKKLLGD
ncbi:MAG: hypothetical protein ACQEQF_00520, partial [Bacillota bacterium]